MSPDGAARCVTCGDGAEPARLIAFVDARTARVTIGEATQDVCLDLVDARVGDVVLVQAGVAIGVVR